MKLYQRLTLALALLLLVGLVVADAATYTALRSSLYGRIDAQLASSQHLAVRYLERQAAAGRAPTAGDIDDRVSPDVYVVVVGRDGRPVVSRPSGSPDHPDPEPVFPTPLRAQANEGRSTFGAAQGAYRPNPDVFVATGPHGSGVSYRAVAVAVPQGTLVVAVPVDPTLATLDSVIRIELLASGLVLIAACLLALWIVRRGMRPLENMTKTAGAIASGDLTRRVPLDDGNSEVAQLGAAFNTMVARIEVAFFEKTASEDRLRRFVADASHELRTPLTSIRGYSELLRKGAFSDEEGRRRAVERIEQEATRMGGLVDDLLLLARLDQGRPLERLPVDLSEVASDTVDDARAADPGRPISLSAGAAVVVLGDPDRLVQVAHNLVRNAIDHTPGETPVTVASYRRGSMGVLEVSDEGPGMASEQAAKAFDRFYRADSARSGQGSGLGLSIVRAIAEALGGTASVASEPGRGARFTVAIPVDPDAPKERSSPEGSERTAAGAVR